MFALSRDAGRFVFSEPELRAALAELEAAGELRCAVCGAPLDAADSAAVVRRRLAHRWASLPAHAECARRLPPPPPRPAGGARPAADDSAVEAGRHGPRPARLGRLEGRLALAVAVLRYEEPAAVTAALMRLHLGDAVPLPDFDPACGATVRALHAAHADADVYAAPGLEITVAPAGPDCWRVGVSTAGGSLLALAVGAPGGPAAFAAALPAGCAVLLAAPSAPAGPEQPIAAVIRAHDRV